MQRQQVDITPLEDLVRELWDRGGTDLHLTVGAPPMVRIDGDLHPLEGQTAYEAGEVDILARAVLTEGLLATLAETGQVDFSFSWRDRSRFRGNAFVQSGTTSLALRAIPRQIPTPEQLLLPPALARLCERKHGLVLMTGPTGSGKSTSQAALIGHINATRRCHILTLEDPIEYVHEHDKSIVAQREVGVDTPSFQQGLRAALREDPDVVLVGEMRDPESIATTLTVAETGHLVFATLHTNDASTALDRIIDVFPAERQAQIRVQLAASLSAVVAQRLVPRVDGGLIGAFEILLNSPSARGLIREGKTHQIRNVISQGVREGMQTLEQSLSVLVSHGLISYQDALDRAVVPKEVQPPPHAAAVS